MKPETIKKKLSHKAHVKYLDRLWADVIRARAGNKSELPPYRNGKLAAHHIGAKNNYRLRYDLDNGICLLNGPEHNYGIHNPNLTEEYREKIKAVKGSDIYERMERLKKYSGKTDLKLVEIMLKQELEKYSK